MSNKWGIVRITDIIGGLVFGEPSEVQNTDIMNVLVLGEPSKGQETKFQTVLVFGGKAMWSMHL